MEITESNYELTLRDTTEPWILVLAAPKYDFKFLELISELATEYPLINFGYTDITSEDGERIKASFESGVVP